MGNSLSTGGSPPALNNPPEGACPVDHKARAAWLEQNKNNTSPHPKFDESSRSKSQRPLSHDREVSSIPRALPTNSSSSSPAPTAPTSPYAQQASATTASHACPSNSESETGQDGKSGNWIYPSERQFYDALIRKNNTPASTGSATELATSVASIIPIHNAVNERAWSEILTWESSAPFSDPGSKKCGGPKLYSFRGLGTDGKYLSPRARFNGLLGYQLPFDRHDWVVERCDGVRMEYVIDFYQGRSQKGAGLNQAPDNGKLSFYLDVRPKLNSWEGLMMRARRLTGL
ncbi:Cytochrome c1 heme lyase [Myotisia sp. PD_48]|nr:Cytochrome c1 heme lyase [Myotisia sp. PD_48]